MQFEQSRLMLSEVSLLLSLIGLCRLCSCGDKGVTGENVIVTDLCVFINDGEGDRVDFG